MLVETLKRFRKREAEAEQTALQLAIKLVEGGDVPDDQVDRAQLQAGISRRDFADLLETLGRRKELIEAIDPEATKAELKRLSTECKAATDELAEAQEQRDALQAKCRELHKRVRLTGGRRSDFQSKSTKLARESKDELRRTGSESDWRDVRWVPALMHD